MSWFRGSESMCTITCVPFIPSRLVLSVISKSQVRWLSHASREILEQRDFPSKKGEEEGTLSKNLLCSRSLTPRNLRGWPLLSHFTNEETEVRDAGANSWQSWELEHSTFRLQSSPHQNVLFSSKTVEQLVAFSLSCECSFWFPDQNIHPVRAAVKPLLTN